MEHTHYGKSYPKRRQRTQEDLRRKKLWTQRMIGFAMLIISAVLFAVASTGTTLETKDGTPLIFTVPLGIYLLFWKEIVIY